MKHSIEYIEKLEQAISEKYGKEAVVDFRENWDDHKEKQYQQELKRLSTGISENKKLLTKVNYKCSICNSFTFKKNDDLYMTKYKCCFKCYIEKIEGREEKWNKNNLPENS